MDAPAARRAVAEVRAGADHEDSGRSLRNAESRFRSRADTRSSTPAVWLVSAKGPGLNVLSSAGVIAVNCHIHFDITGLSAEQILNAEAHSAEWNRLPSARRRWANELAAFAGAIAEGDVIIAKTAAGQPALVGTVASQSYRYDPATIRDHHTSGRSTGVGPSRVRCGRGSLAKTGARFGRCAPHGPTWKRVSS